MPPNPSLCMKLAAITTRIGATKNGTQHQHQRRYVEPAENAIACGHDSRLVRISVRAISEARSGPAQRRPARARQATLKSFQRLFM